MSKPILKILSVTLLSLAAAGCSESSNGGGTGGGQQAGQNAVEPVLANQACTRTRDENCTNFSGTYSYEYETRSISAGTDSPTVTGPAVKHTAITTAEQQGCSSVSAKTYEDGAATPRLWSTCADSLCRMKSGSFTCDQTWFEGTSILSQTWTKGASGKFDNLVLRSVMRLAPNGDLLVEVTNYKNHVPSSSGSFTAKRLR